jgi:rhodanese-related sulfurtransferase
MRAMHQTVHDLINAAKNRIREVSPAELLDLQRAGSPIVDVREPEEFAEDHIPGAVNIPRGLLEFEVDGHPAVNYQTAEELSHRERPVVLYCLSGGRSLLAADALRRLGFRSPVSLVGGILGWADQGHQVATPVALDPVRAQSVNPGANAGCRA